MIFLPGSKMSLKFFSHQVYSVHIGQIIGDAVPGIPSCYVISRSMIRNHLSMTHQQYKQSTSTGDNRLYEDGSGHICPIILFSRSVLPENVI